jgi:hypothetical protein
MSTGSEQNRACPFADRLRLGARDDLLVFTSVTFVLIERVRALSEFLSGNEVTV